MNSDDADIMKYKKFGTTAIILEVVALVLGIGTYLLTTGGRAGLFPDMPALYISLTVVIAVILVIALVLQAIAMVKNAVSKGQEIADIILWILAAVVFFQILHLHNLLPW